MLRLFLNLSILSMLYDSLLIFCRYGFFIFIILCLLFFRLFLILFLSLILPFFVFSFTFILILIIFLLRFLFKLFFGNFDPFEIVVKIFYDKKWIILRKLKFVFDCLLKILKFWFFTSLKYQFDVSFIKFFFDVSFLQSQYNLIIFQLFLLIKDLSN